MGVTINVRKKIVVNGVEYDGPEALPPDLRAAYERAMAARGLGSGGLVKVTFDGRDYASVDQMPPEVRALYEAAMKTVSGGGPPRPPAGPDGDARPVVDARPVQLGPAPSSSVLRWLALGVGLVLLLALLYLLGYAGGR